MWGLPIESIGFWQRVVSFADAVALVAAVITGGALFISAKVSSDIASVVKADADRRIAEAQARGEEARAQAAKAEQRAAEATLELAKYRAARTLTVEQQGTITEKLRAFSGVQFDASIIPDDAETYHLLDMIAPALEAAGWVQENWNSTIVFKRPGKPDLGEWAATNVIVAVPHHLIPKLWVAATSLASALTVENIPAQAQDATGMNVTNNNVLHLLIGRKM